LGTFELKEAKKVVAELKLLKNIAFQVYVFATGLWFGEIMNDDYSNVIMTFATSIAQLVGSTSSAFRAHFFHTSAFGI
jgi:hypothetical protein